MESAAQDSLAAVVAKETWTADDHASLLKTLAKTPEAPRRLRGILADLEASNPQPKGGAALKIGIARYMLCRLNSAVTALNEATDNKDRRYFLALCYSALRQYDKAVEELERARSRGWDNLEIDLLLVEATALKGDLAAAAKLLAKLKDKASGRAEYFYLQGLIDDLGGLAAKAADAYLAALKITPDYLEAQFRLAYLYDLHGEEDQALELYKKCRSHPPVHVSTLMNMAVLYEDRGDYAKAITCLETILQNNPGHLRSRLFLKDAQASMTMYYDEEQAKRVARRNAVLDIPVTDFELSVRARNCLKKMNIRSLGDLVRISEAELLSYKNFGETSLREIKEMLTAKGLHLGQALEEEGLLRVEPAQAEPVAAAATAAPADGGSALSTSIDNVAFSIRSRRALANLNIKTLGDLASKSEAELLTCKNFGQTSLNEVRQRLGEYGLQLRE